jgi:hypothetical protein
MLSDRTSDSTFPNQTRYQTALCPAGHRRSIHTSVRCGKQAQTGSSFSEL